MTTKGYIVLFCVGVFIVAALDRLAYVAGYQAAEQIDAKTRMHESPFVFLEMSKRGDRG